MAGSADIANALGRLARQSLPCPVSCLLSPVSSLLSRTSVSVSAPVPMPMPVPVGFCHGLGRAAVTGATKRPGLQNSSIAAEGPQTWVGCAKRIVVCPECHSRGRSPMCCCSLSRAAVAHRAGEQLLADHPKPHALGEAARLPRQYTLTTGNPVRHGTALSASSWRELVARPRSPEQA